MLALKQHNASLSNLNLRIERHGDERQLAADLKLSTNVAGSVLNDIERGLHESLYRQPGAGEQPDLIDPALLTAVKFPQMEPVRLSHKFPGYELEIVGSEDDEPVFLAGVELKKITAHPLEGGSAELTFTVSANVEPEDVHELTALYIRDDVVISLKPPTVRGALDAGKGAPVNDEGERCENDQADCGPVEFHDTEGVPLCKRCWDELPALDSDQDDEPEAANDADGATGAAA